MGKRELYDKAFYETNKKDINSAEKILSYILNKLQPKSIVDFGCGSGTWLAVAENMGYKNILGIDGDYVDKQWLLFDSSKFLSADLTKEIKLEKKFDLAISLEVAEHIDEKYSETYLKNLTSAADIILFSAAIPNQNGTNHVNEQFPSYWIKKFEKYDFYCHDSLRQIFWNDENLAFWYKQNIMFFVRKDKAKNVEQLFPILKMPTDLVHPVKLKNAVNEAKIETDNELNKLKDNYNRTIENIEKENLEKIAMIERESMKTKKELEKVIEEKEECIKEFEKNYKVKVSVVVPVFNVKTYLRECLDSILNQTLTEIEVLCGDGGSNDGSLEILREYEKKDKRVKVISRDGSGYGQSVNECMDLAKGEYIGIVESDDKIDKNMYETLYLIAKQNDLDWIRSDIYFYYSQMPKKKQLAQESITYGAPMYNEVLNPKHDVRPYKSALHTWAGIYKREFLNNYHIRHHETPGGSYQDVGFYLKTLYDAERVYFLDKPFYYWRQDNPGSSIHYNAKKLVEKSFTEWQLNKEYLELRPDSDKRLWCSFNYRRYYSYLWTIEMANDIKEETKEYAKKELKEALKSNQVSKKFFSPDEWKSFMDFIKEK